MSTLRIHNRDARRLWLNATGLATTPTGQLHDAKSVLNIVDALGFIQLDSIQNISRAHHHILWSRNQHYREPMLDELLRNQRAVFEHFSHDACVLPMASYPWWRRQFARMAARVGSSTGNHAVPEHAVLDKIRQRICSEGPLSTRAFESETPVKAMWVRPSHKRALDYLWYAGVLATSHRISFTKYYDLAERVVPAALREQHVDDPAQIDWLCHAALSRLAFASTGELQRFWNALSLAEARAWIEVQPATTCQPVLIESAQGEWLSLHGVADIEHRLAMALAPTTRLRIINPFDPAVRDRQRLYRLFGIDYTNEIFVPAASRRWGYYVYLLLEGDRFVGRLEARAERASSTLQVKRVWAEAGVHWGAARLHRLDAELARLARLAGLNQVGWHCARAAQASPC